MGLCVGDGDAGDQLRGIDALVRHRVVDREEAAGVAGLDQRVDRLEQHAVAAAEDAAPRLVARDRAGEGHERGQRVTLVVGAFLVIAVGREQPVDLGQEAALAVLRGAQQRLFHQFGLAQDIAGHAHAGGRPGGVVVDRVEAIRGFLRQEACGAPEQVVDAPPLVRRQRVADGVVALDRVHQPDRIVELLPEQPARGLLAAPRGMRAEGRVQPRVGQQHVAHVVGVGALAGEPVQRAGALDGLVVALVLFVGVAAAGILRHRHDDALGHRRAHHAFDPFLLGREQRCARGLFAHAAPFVLAHQHGRDRRRGAFRR